MQVKQNHFGDVTVTWREPMTPAEVSDLESFLNLWVRGIKRRVEADRMSAAAQAALDFIAGLPAEFHDTSRDNCEADLRAVLPLQPL